MKLIKKLLALGAMLTACIGLSVASTACLEEKPWESAPDSVESSSSSLDEIFSESSESASSSESVDSSIDSSESVDSSIDSTESVDSSIDSTESSSDSSVNENELAYIYRVSLQNETGFGFSGATVTLKDGDTVVAQKKTNASGNANFLEADIAAVGNYDVVISDAPAGYALPDETYQTLALAGTDTTVVITPTGILEGEAPSGTFYKLGDVVYDFTITLSDGTTFILSEELKTKDMILLNFWATWCGPCKSEFPALHTAAMAYADTVTVLAISTTDTRDAVASFKATEKLDQFKMAPAGSGYLSSMFSVSSIPHSVIIDRYGVVAFNEVGSMPSVGAFTVQFDKFVGEDYTPVVVGGAHNGGDTPDVPDAPTQIKPTVEAPNVDELKEVFTDETTASFNFRFQEEEGLIPGDEEYDEYNWPWLISEDKTYIYASNANVHGSYAILYATMEAKAGDVLTFDYKVGSELDVDILYLMIDGVPVKKYSGNQWREWTTDYAYVFRDYEAGEHEVAFIFLKDSETTANDDIIQLKNLRTVSVDSLDSPDVDANVFRYAATELNTDPDAKTQYKNYVDVFYNANDDYYHVGSENGPVLYANMTTSSLWNETSLWMLAYNDYVVGDGMNYHTAIEGFAWEAVQITTVAGYTPVTEDLKYLLDVAVRYTTVGQLWEGEYHANEWLELCVYWEHYGQTELPPDPMAGITFTAAIPMQEGANQVNVPYALNPRGFKYKFVPERSGAYKVYSTGTSDSIVMLVDADRVTHLGYWDNKVFVEVLTDEDGNDISDDNFEFYWYFEAGKTYYMLFTTYLDMTASYNVNIDYIAESYTYLENAATGPYSANLNTFELFLPDAIEYAYSDPEKGGDGYYHHVKEDGTLGGIIYLDVNRPTAFFNTASLYDICRQAENYDEEKRALYLNGKDYTDAFYQICFKANLPTNKMKGFAAVDQELFELLQILTLSEKYDGISNSWLLLCYYDRTLAANE